ncbi:MAG: precorrin-3B C(17)-methyltransferase [Magnetococcales bacterium]|nr:precorrin-3B C(17)-methyltransferase [Magnetococcales bacterium]
MCERGRLYLVGIGPGDHRQLTQRAREAIAEADTVVGYKTYLRLLDGLLDGKQVVASAMREELDRCAEACRLAMAGRRVALISSGDPGVYGMAGPTYELLFHAGWRPATGVVVEVVPGVTALTACAALVGAPLTHDFCAISLSDLLTPWEVIEKRLSAAAMADFVTALYNPRSGRRDWQLLRAREIFLQHRSPATPVAVVSAAFRDRQQCEITTLDGLDRSEPGMQSTVLIGNSRTRSRDGLLVTPRGYGDKYDLERGLAAGVTP